jgi:hypothetical protein
MERKELEMTTNNRNRVSTRHRRDELAERDLAANDPAGFQKLKPKEQAALVDWIRAVLVPAKTVFRRNSYGMKHDFDHEPDGFYVYNGAFKGAMLAAGFHPVDENDLNWRFRVKPAHELARWEQRQRGVYGRGWLVRNRWREKGYEVLQETQRLRTLEHSRECWREHRPRVVVLRAKYLAQVFLDTEPAGHRLTREGVATVLAVFVEFDPKGQHSYVINEHLAVIQRVPAWRAEEVASALLKIAQGCAVAASNGASASAIDSEKRGEQA